MDQTLPLSPSHPPSSHDEDFLDDAADADADDEENDVHDAFVVAMEAVARAAPWASLPERTAFPVRMTSSREPLGYVSVLGHRFRRPGIALFATRAAHQRFVRSVSRRHADSLPGVPALVALCEGTSPSGQPVALATFEGTGVKLADDDTRRFLTLVARLIHDLAAGNPTPRTEVGFSIKGKAEHLSLDAPIDCFTLNEPAGTRQAVTTPGPSRCPVPRHARVPADRR